MPDLGGHSSLHAQFVPGKRLVMASTTHVRSLRRLFGEAMVARGLDYVFQRRVQSIDVVARNSLRATVKGSGKNIYSLNASFELVDGVLVKAATICTCPVVSQCKHGVAVLYRHLSELPDPPAVAQSSVLPADSAAGMFVTSAVPDPILPSGIQSWLEEVSAAQQGRSTLADAYRETVRDRLLYVVLGEGRTAINVVPHKVQLRKDGSFSPKPARYDIDQVNWDHPPGFLLAVDRLLAYRLREQGLRRRPYAAWVDPRSLAPLMPGDVLATLDMIAKTGRGRVNGIDGPLLTAGPDRPAEPVWQESESGAQQLRLLDPDGEPLVLLPGEPPAYVDCAQGTFGRLETPHTAHILRTMLQAPPLMPADAAALARAIGGRTSLVVPKPKPLGVRRRSDIRPIPVLTLRGTEVRMPEPKRSGYYRMPPPRPVEQVLPTASLGFRYEDALVSPDNRTEPTIRRDDEVITVERHYGAEAEFAARLEAHFAGRLADFDLKATTAAKARSSDLVFADWREPAQDAVAFLAGVVPELRASGWQIVIDESWPCPLYDGPVQFEAGVTAADGGWFQASLQIVVDGKPLDLVPIISAIIDILPVTDDGEVAEDFSVSEFLEDLVLYPSLPDGRYIALHGEALAPVVEACLTTLSLFGRLHQAQAGEIPLLAEVLAGCGIPFKVDAAVMTLARRLQALREEPNLPVPACVQAQLRPYQQAGYAWLLTLVETSFGGILADDMGLGKTLQALAMLAKRHLEDHAERPSLLVVPTSLVGNWVQEAARFVPELKVLALHGAARQAAFGEIGAHHLVITTYPLLHRDSAILAGQAWEVILLDEAQAVKNPASASAKLIRTLKGKARIALTGTPVENSLEDLWALFDWLIPGLLGDRQAFRQDYKLPIERDGSGAVQADLNRRLRPFILRRTKQDVLAELPDKTEIADLVTLGAKQQALYETMRAAMDKRVREAIATRGLAASRITILDALLKLRQICCDPALLKTPTPPSVGSAKRERLLELLDELVARGHRILVFSQFVEMLRLIEADVQNRGWRYAWLTGDTKDRAAVVQQFQDGDAPIFLISLKAGGTGLTLTGADTVILYDPWWNPAVERQAMDRAHRLGQQKAVFVHRLIAEGTVEQAIALLQARKQAMADALFEGKASGPLNFGEDDLALLFGAH